MLNAFIRRLAYDDPGLARLLHASKTVVAVIIAWLAATWLFNNTYIELYAGLIAGISSLFAAGNTRQAAMVTLLMAGLSLTAGKLLGMAMQPYHQLSLLVLLALTFIAFYLQRFGLRYRMFPPVAVVFYLLALVAPAGESIMLLEMAGGCLIGVFSIWLMYFWVLPVQPNLQARHHAINVISRMGNLIHYLVAGLKPLDQAQLTSARLYFVRLLQLIRLGDEFYNRIVTQNENDKRLQSDYLVKEYAVAKMLGMIWESLMRLAEAKALPTVASDKIIACLNAYHRVLLQFQALYQDPLHGPMDMAELQNCIRALRDYTFSSEVCQATYAGDFTNLCFGVQRLYELMQLWQAIVLEGRGRV